MMKLKNPETGEVVEISPFVWVWVLLFGVFYFAFKGMWTHVLAGTLFAIVTMGLSWLIYPFFATDIMRKHYLRKGWIEIPPEA